MLGAHCNRLGKACCIETRVAPGACGAVKDAGERGGATRAVYVQVAAALTAIGTPRTATGVSRQRRPVDSERAQAAQDCRQGEALG